MCSTAALLLICHTLSELIPKLSDSCVWELINNCYLERVNRFDRSLECKIEPLVLVSQGIEEKWCSRRHQRWESQSTRALRRVMLPRSAPVSVHWTRAHKARRGLGIVNAAFIYRLPQTRAAKSLMMREPESIPVLFAHRQEYFPHIQVRGFRDGTCDDLGAIYLKWEMGSV